MAPTIGGTADSPRPLGWRAMTTRTRGWRMGTLAGVPVYLGRSWLLIAAVVVLLLGPVVSRLQPGIGGWAYAAALGFAVLLLVSVLVHEAAHALVAQATGHRVTRIVADFWGGHTAYEGADSTPGRSALVAVAGPAANAVLAVVGWLLTPLVPTGGIPALLLAGFVWSNAFVAVFNLLPGLPLDGGFLVDALVWRLSGSRGAGMLVAGWTGRLLTLGLVWWAIGLPVLQGQQPTLTRLAYAVLIGSFLWVGASDAVRVGRARRALEGVRVAEVAVPLRLVPLDAPVGALGTPGEGTWVATGPDGAPAGLVDDAALARVPAHLRDGTPVAAVSVPQPPTWRLAADPGEDLTRVVVALQTHRLPAVVLLDPSGRPWGLVHARSL